MSGQFFLWAFVGECAVFLTVLAFVAIEEATLARRGKVAPVADRPAATIVGLDPTLRRQATVSEAHITDIAA